MTALVVAVFIASVMGSMHCAGMCGAFLAFAVAGEAMGVRAKAMLNGAYNLGRLVTYTALGTIAGAAGHAIDLGGSVVGIQRAATVTAGVLMVGFGVVAVLRALGVHVRRAPLPAGLSRMVSAGHRAAAHWPPLVRAAAIGLLTTLLPCGWLYAFVVTAAGTGGWKLGAASMAAFWLGTLPVMISLGTGVQAASGALRRRLPLLTSLLLVGVGVWTLAGRLTMPSLAGVHSRVQPVSSGPQVPVPGEAPCCRDE